MSSVDDLALALFYEKRISEERAIAEARGDEHGVRDADAKMRILQHWRPPADVKEQVKDCPSPAREIDIAIGLEVDFTVRVLAAVYQDHEDYRQEWAPGA